MLPVASSFDASSNRLEPARHSSMALPILFSSTSPPDQDHFQAVQTGLDFSQQDWTGERFETILQALTLRNANFSEASLYHAQLTAKDLTGARFDDAQLVEANLAESILDDSRHYRTNYYKAFLYGAKVHRAQFQYTNLTQAIMTGCFGDTPEFLCAKMAGCRLDRSQLEAPSFEYCDLSNASLNGVLFSSPLLDPEEIPNQFTLKSTIAEAGANFTGAILSGCNIKGSNLMGANFTRTNLSGKNTPAVIINTYLQYANFSDANLSGVQFQKSRLQAANFRHANLSNTNFSKVGQAEYLVDTDFTAADLTASNLSGLDLTECRLKQAIFNHANLCDTDLRGVDLRDIAWDEQTQWQSAKYNRSTRLPAGFDPKAHGMTYRPSLIERLLRPFRYHPKPTLDASDSLPNSHPV